MSNYNMDDLIASFASTAHISQDAIDLAALQAQLSNSLMGAGSSRAVVNRACPTTPTMGTMELAQYPPSATPSPQTNVHHSFGGPSYSHVNSDLEDMMDEEMIEQSLLEDSSSSHPSHHDYSHTGSLGLQNHYPHINQIPVGPTPSAQYYGATEESLSSYAAMDPFFAAQLQAAQLQQQQQQQQLQQSYFGSGGGLAPARGFGARHQPSLSTSGFATRRF